jgi:hypothetical protein
MSDIHLLENDLFWSQLPHHCLQLRPANIILERAQAELRGRAVKDTNSKTVVGLGVFFFGYCLADRDAMSSLLVCKKLLVHEGAIRVDLVEFADF